MDTDLHVVIGAAGGTGRALLDELGRRGHRVRGVGRNEPRELPGGIEWRTADASTHPGAESAVEGAAVVYHAAQPPYPRWVADFPALTNAIADAAMRAGAKFVLADNLYAYGPGASPLSEQTPEGATDRKGRLRAEMAAALMRRHQAGGLEVAIGRAPTYFGPNGTGTMLGERVFGSAVKGKAVRWLGRLDAPHSTVFLPDLAAALATLGERPEASGKVWHVPAQPALTGRQFGDALVNAANSGSTVGVDSETVLRLVGLFNPFVREVADVAYQHTAPFVTDSSAYEAAFGEAARTPFDQALDRTLAWWRQHAATEGR